MKAVNGKILVRSDPDQKRSLLVAGFEVLVASSFNPNYRERSPVLCQVQHDSEQVKAGDILICHHNTFQNPSPHHLYDDLYSIPERGTIIFCKVSESGVLLPLYGNMMVETIRITDRYARSFEERGYYIDRVCVSDPGTSGYEQGDTLFTRPFGAYEMVYNWNGQERRVFKCHESQVVGRFIPTPT